MPEEPFALSTISPLPAEESDYDAICATVMESARGRWFLQEYARRNRNADTRLVLAAIERLEHLIRTERNQQAHPGMRAELLEMARAIAQARAEDAGGTRYPDAHPRAAGAEQKSPPGPPDIHETAERLQDVAWTMRERGLDPATCEEIESLASSIVASSSLQDPADDRVRKLTAVLAYLERRIAGMLEPGAQADAPDPESAANAERLIESDASVPEGSAVQGHSTEELTIEVPRSMGAGVLPDAAPAPPNSSEMGAEQPRPALRLPKAEDSTASPPADIGLASTLESPDQPSSPATGESAPVASDRVELAAPTNVSAVSHTQHEFVVDEPLSSAAVAQPAHAGVSAYSQESTTPDPSHPVTSLEGWEPNQAERIPPSRHLKQIRRSNSTITQRHRVKNQICRATSSARLHAPLRLPRPERLRMRMLRIPNKPR